MITHRAPVGLFVALAIAGSFLDAAGCSSSSPRAPAGGVDAASGADGGKADGSGSDSTVPDSARSGDAGVDAPEPMDATGDADAGGDAFCPVAPAAATFHAMPYVPAVANQGVCTPVAIATFVLACGDNGSPQSCAEWAASHVAGDGGPGDPCGNCIMSPSNNGPGWVDPDGELNPNSGACIQIVAGTEAGTACASAYNDSLACQGIACDQCGLGSLNGCIDAALDGPCKAYGAAEVQDCPSSYFEGDGGVATTCFGSGVATFDQALTVYAGMICGGVIRDGGAD